MPKGLTNVNKSKMLPFCYRLPFSYFNFVRLRFAISLCQIPFTFYFIFIKRFLVSCSQKQFNLKQPALYCTLCKDKTAGYFNCPSKIGQQLKHLRKEPEYLSKMGPQKIPNHFCNELGAKPRFLWI